MEKVGRNKGKQPVAPPPTQSAAHPNPAPDREGAGIHAPPLVVTRLLTQAATRGTRGPRFLPDVQSTPAPPAVRQT